MTGNLGGNFPRYTGSLTRLRDAGARWPHRRPDPAPEISRGNSGSSPTPSITVRDRYWSLWLALSKMVLLAARPYAALVAVWWWVSDWLAVTLGVLWMAYRAIRSGSRGSPSSEAARVERSPRRWSR